MSRFDLDRFRAAPPVSAPFPEKGARTPKTGIDLVRARLGRLREELLR